MRAIGRILDAEKLEDQKIASLLLSRFEQAYDGRSIRVPFFEALLAVKDMLRAAIVQFKRIEDVVRAVEVQDLLQKELPGPGIEEAGTEHKNLVDVNMLLSVLVQLEDQLYQMASQSDSLSDHAKEVLYGREMSRAHTAYGRLSSLMALPSYKQAHPLALAEQGICNVGDANLTGGLRFYQQHQVEFESLHHHINEAGEYDATAALETQFKNDYFTRGFKTWNVPFSKSLNSMPPKAHQTGLPSESAPVPISNLQKLSSSDFVLSSSSDDASINIWSTRAGLTQISSLNFKL